MIGDPVVTVACDSCDYVQDYGMTALAGGCYDMRALPNAMKRDGWVKDGDQCICSDCWASAQSAKALCRKPAK